MGEKMDAHVLFDFTVANDGQLPMKMYTELDVNCLGLKVDRRHHTNFWTSPRVEFDMACIPGFCEKHGGEIFNSFECPGGINPLLFCQLCLDHYVEISKEHNL